jgi:hypothetical protein
MGDYWQHTITVVDLVMPVPGTQSGRCTAGENACPPEDVGSAGGYADFLTAIADPSHEEHDNMLEWVGGSFDPTVLSLEDINERLADIKA